MESPSDRGLIAVLAIGGSAIALMILLVASGLRRSAPEAFAPTPLELRPARGRLVGPTLVTVDATRPDRWRFFSFEDGTVAESPDPLGWDLAFRRFQVIANGGAGFAGTGGIAKLGEVALNDVGAVPATGYLPNTVGSDTVNEAVQEWYDYSYFSHLLSPKPTVYAIRTATGRFAKLQFVGYYCPGAVPGCVTFRYVFQGAGGVDMLPGAAEGASGRGPR